jgi:hypothetical protein
MDELSKFLYLGERYEEGPDPEETIWKTDSCARGDHDQCEPLPEIGCDCPCHDK